MTNPTFANGSDGLATGWSFGGVAAPFAYADFGNVGNTMRSYAEGFELHWGADPLVTELTLTNTVRAFLGHDGDEPRLAEQFENGWGNDVYATELVGGSVALFNGAETGEGFEAGWANDADLTALPPGAGVVAATLGGAASPEGCETGYDPAYAASLDDATTATAAFRGGVDLAEVFTPLSEPREVAVQGNLFALDGHGFVNGTLVRFSGASLPPPLSAELAYAVSSATSATFRVTRLGTEVVLTGTGTPPVFVAGDPSVFWNTRLESL